MNSRQFMRCFHHSVDRSSGTVGRRASKLRRWRAARAIINSLRLIEIIDESTEKTFHTKRTQIIAHRFLISQFTKNKKRKIAFPSSSSSCWGGALEWMSRRPSWSLEEKLKCTLVLAGTSHVNVVSECLHGRWLGTFENGKSFLYPLFCVFSKSSEPVNEV